MPDINDITSQILSIPAETPPLDLINELQPIILDIAQCDQATQSAMLHHVIKPHFNMTLADIKGYERLLKATAKSLTTKEDSCVQTACMVPDLIHLVKSHDGKIKYLINTITPTGTPTIEIHDTVTVNDITYQPKQESDRCIKNLPTEDIITHQYEYKPDELLKDIEHYLYRHVELPNNKHYMIPALWIMHTYIVDLLGRGATSPIMVFHGLKASGKTRVKDICVELTFRAFGFTHPSEANMYILPEMYKPTMLIDEITLFGKNPKTDLANLIKTRYKEGGFVPRMRTDKPGNTEDKMEFPITFGATLLSTTEHLGEFIDDRSIEFIMVKNERQEVESKIDYEAAKALCDRLIHFRHYWMNHTPLPEFESIARRRQGEILNPLWQMLNICDPTPERIAEFKQFTADIETQKKEIEYDTKQAAIFRAILSIVKQREDMTFTTKEVLTSINSTLKDTDPHKSTEQWLGRKIHNMGFEMVRVKSSRHWMATESLIKSLSDRFGITADEATQPEIPF